MNEKFYKTVITVPVAVFFLVVSLFSLPAQAETINYVSDELTVPVRSGTSSQHRILLFVKSGTALKILEVNEDGSYSRVSTPDGKEGWVESKDLATQPSARDRLASANNRLDKSNEKAREMKVTISALQTENKNLKKQLAAAEEKGRSLENDIAHFKKVTANPLALANSNRVLEADLKASEELNEQLKDKNKRLSDQSTKEWFILGAAVSLGSLLFGLLITRIRWQKKRGWGDF
jgi:SH3 domain protein